MNKTGLVLVGFAIGMLPWLLTSDGGTPAPSPTPTQVALAATASPTPRPALTPTPTPTPTETPAPERNIPESLTSVNLRVDTPVQVKTRRVAMDFLNKDGLVCLDDSNHLESWGLYAAGPKRLWRVNAPGNDMSMAADHSKVAVTNREQARVYCTDEGDVLSTVDREDQDFTFSSLSPDARLLAIGRADGEVHIFDLAAKELEMTQSLDSTGLKSINFSQFSPEAGRLAVFGISSSSGRAQVNIYRVKDWEKLRVLETEIAGSPGNLSFAQDGRLLALAMDDGQMQVWDCWTGQKVHSFQQENAVRGRVALAAEGRLLASSGNSKLCIWDVESGELIHTEGLKAGDQRGRCVAWSPSAVALGTAGGPIRIWWMDK